MKDRNIIRKKINIPVLVSKKLYYRLSYCIKSGKNGKLLSDPQYMTTKDMIRYINLNYKYIDEIDEGKLINDLVVFKSYKDNLEQNIRKDDLFSNFITDLVTLFIGIVALVTSLEKILEDVSLYFSFLKIYGFLIFLIYIFYVIRSSKKYYFEYLKTINSIIHILEAIKGETDITKNITV